MGASYSIRCSSVFPWHIQALKWSHAERYTLLALVLFGHFFICTHATWGRLCSTVWVFWIFVRTGVNLSWSLNDPVWSLYCHDVLSDSLSLSKNLKLLAQSGWLFCFCWASIGELLLRRLRPHPVQVAHLQRTGLDLLKLCWMVLQEPLQSPWFCTATVHS